MNAKQIIKQRKLSKRKKQAKAIFYITGAVLISAAAAYYLLNYL